MALVSPRFGINGGSLWDEEVVPALRKRLESESKTLARRLSAVSLPSGDESVTIGVIKKGSVTSPLSNSHPNSQGPRQPSKLGGPGQSQSHRRTTSPNNNLLLTSGPKTPTTSSSRPTNTNPSTTRKYHRSRTYSSPYGSDMDYPDSPPSHSNGAAHKTKERKVSTDNTANTSGTKYPPTRIPKAHRPPTYTPPQLQNQMNGYTYPNTPNGVVATNSYGHTANSSYSDAVTPTPQSHTTSIPDTYRQASLDYPRSTPPTTSASTSQRGLGIGIPPSTSTSSRSTFDLPRGSSGLTRSVTTGYGIGLMNEPAPFPTETSMASGLSSSQLPKQKNPRKEVEEKGKAPEQEQQEEDPPRPSFESEERCFEHWYRGEVSRNGGVGELKVGKRQEMLDIANYGHMIRNRDRDRRKQQRLGTYEDDYRSRDEWRGQAPIPAERNGRGHRKRAESISGLTNKERERGSLYLDDEDGGGERVMDQEPLTDLDMDMEGEEGLEAKMNVGFEQREAVVVNIKTQIEVDPEDEDEFVVVESFTTATPRLGFQPPPPQMQMQRSTTPTPTAPQMPQTPTAHRSTTPTAASVGNRSTTPTSSTGRPSNATSIPRTRIPSRKSSDSKSTVVSNANGTPTTAAAVAAAAAAAITASSVSTGSGTTSGALQSQSQQVSTASQKRGAPPGTPGTPSKRTRTPSSKVKSTSKTPPSATKKGKENRDKEKEKDGKRTSVAMYPAVEGGDELADAIPSWVEPVSEGNWDDVVLPVVARKKGLDGYYENTSGSLHQLHTQQVKARAKPVEPAPGTFRYDHSKYKPFTDDKDDANANDDDDTFATLDEFGLQPTAVEIPPPEPQTRVVVAQKPNQDTLPQPLPYVKPDFNSMPTKKVHQMEMEEQERGGAGCCRCIVM